MEQPRDPTSVLEAIALILGGLLSVSVGVQHLWRANEQRKLRAGPTSSAVETDEPSVPSQPTKFVRRSGV